MIILPPSKAIQHTEYDNEIASLVIEMTQQCSSDRPEVWKEMVPELHDRYYFLIQQKALYQLLFPQNKYHSIT